MKKSDFLASFINDIWNDKKLDKVETYVYPGYKIFLDTADPWEGKTLSHAEFKKRLKYSFDAFPDMYFEITSAIEDEHHVAITWILTGTNSGMMGVLPPTNKKIKTKGITIYHFTDNLISGHTQVFDRKTVAKQLGFLK